MSASEPMPRASRIAFAIFVLIVIVGFSALYRQGMAEAHECEAKGGVIVQDQCVKSVP